MTTESDRLIDIVGREIQLENELKTENDRHREVKAGIREAIKKNRAAKMEAYIHRDQSTLEGV